MIPAPSSVGRHSTTLRNAAVEVIPGLQVLEVFEPEPLPGAAHYDGTHDTSPRRRFYTPATAIREVEGVIVYPLRSRPEEAVMCYQGPAELVVRTGVISESMLPPPGCQMRSYQPLGGCARYSHTEPGYLVVRRRFDGQITVQLTRAEMLLQAQQAAAAALRRLGSMSTGAQPRSRPTGRVADS